MKKQFTIFLILIFVFGLVPVDFSNAITQNQIDAEVQIVCTDGEDNWFSGSGTIIDPNGIILTNRHVIEGAYMNTCFIGFLESINQKPDFGTDENPYLAEIKYYTTTDNMDAAILYLDNPTNKIYPYVNIWNSNLDTLQFGDKVEVIGFPSIGGSTITYTSGDFSGFGSNSDGTQNYIKTTAPLEHGNSGGGAYNLSGQFIGIPTMVVAGELNSMSYVLSVNSIKDWLSNILGNEYQRGIAEQKPTIEKPTISIQNDATPPFQNIFKIMFYAIDESGKEIYFGSKTGEITGAVYEFSKLRFAWHVNCTKSSRYDYCINDDSGKVVAFYYYFGSNPNANPKIDGKYIKYEDMIIDSLGEMVKLPEIITTNNGKNNFFILQAVDDSGNISNPIINFEYVYISNNDRDIKEIYIFNKNNELIGEIVYPTPAEIPSVRDYPNVPDSMWLDYTSVSVGTSADVLYLSPYYDYKINGLIYYFTYGDDDNFAKTDNKYREGTLIENNFIKIENIQKNKKINVFIKPNKTSTNAFKGSNKILEINFNKYVQNDYMRPVSSAGYLLKFNKLDNNFISQLKGQILLQVESKGEAYYIYPEDSKRYYLGRPADAFGIMRKLGLGATHEFITSNTTFPDHVLGKILLDVEQNGEAYYIYPKDKKSYYLGRPADAFQVMRNLGLGITNNDVRKIDIGEVE